MDGPPDNVGVGEEDNRVAEEETEGSIEHELEWWDRTVMVWNIH
mgnify:CR=1 FL=1